MSIADKLQTLHFGGSILFGAGMFAGMGGAMEKSWGLIAFAALCLTFAAMLFSAVP